MHLTHINKYYFSSNGFSDGPSANKSDLNLSSSTQEEALEKQMNEVTFDATKTNESEKNEKKQPVEQVGNCYWYILDVKILVFQVIKLKPSNHNLLHIYTKLEQANILH